MNENKTELPFDEAALKAATVALAVSDMSTRDPWELPEHRAKRMAYVQEHSDEWRDDAEACVRAYLEAIQQSKDADTAHRLMGLISQYGALCAQQGKEWTQERADAISDLCLQIDGGIRGRTEQANGDA